MNLKRSAPITSIAALLAQKAQLVARLEEEPGTEERDQIERLLEQINAALVSLEDEDVEAD